MVGKTQARGEAADRAGTRYPRRALNPEALRLIKERQILVTVV